MLTDSQIGEKAREIVLKMRGESSCHCDSKNDFKCFLCEDREVIASALRSAYKEGVEDAAKALEENMELHGASTMSALIVGKAKAIRRLCERKTV